MVAQFFSPLKLIADLKNEKVKKKFCNVNILHSNLSWASGKNYHLLTHTYCKQKFC